jgi:type IV fimbrial biogenesis protein FimT
MFTQFSGGNTLSGYRRIGLVAHLPSIFSHSLSMGYANTLQNIFNQNRKNKKQNRGVTLVELMITITIFSLLTIASIPSFSNWIKNARIRSATESITNGLQLTRATAVRINGQASFNLCGADSTWSALAASAVASTTSCGATVTGWSTIQNRTGAEGGGGAQVTSSQASIVFNSLGQVTPNPGALISISITNPSSVSGLCAPAGKLHCLRVVVSPAGQIRACDPALSLPDPQGC